MISSPFFPSWDERLAEAPKLAPLDPLDLSADLTPVLDSWRALIDPAGLGNFERRLSWDGINFGHAVAMLAQNLDTAGSSPWVHKLTKIRSQLSERSIDFDHNVGEGAIPFYHVLAPLVEQTTREFFDSLNPLTTLIPTALMEQELVKVLISRLSHMTSRTLLAAAGARSYQQFCNDTLSDALESLLAEYPGIGRLLGIVTLQWEKNTRSLLERVHQDRDTLLNTFGIPLNAGLCGLTLALSDPHRGGQEVAVLFFCESHSTDSHPGWSVVYKPKDMRIEAEFNDFLGWIKSQLPGESLRQITIAAVGETHGYAEFIEHIPCESSGLPEFYENSGRLLGIIYMVNGSDCHTENLIANGTDLFLIDAETIFDSELSNFIETEPSVIDGLQDSVLRIGMLPNWRSIAVGAPLADWSALGIDSAIKATVKTRGWVKINSDAMHLDAHEIPARAPTSLPVSLGVANPLSNHLEEIISGFTQVYNLVLNPDIRVEIARRFQRFHGINRRIVMRNTSTYAILSSRALRPECMAQPLLRGIEIDRLSRSWLIATEQTAHWKIFHEELRAMENYDIPYFDFPLGSTSIRSDFGDIEGVISSEGIHAATLRLERFSPSELEWQARLIRGAFASRDSIHQAQQSSSAEIVEFTALTPTQIANQLTDLTLKDTAGNPTWLVLEAQGNADHFALQSISLNLYGGRAGLMAFFSSQRSDVQVTEAMVEVESLFTHSQDGAAFRAVRDNGLGINGIGGVARLYEYLETNSSLEPGKAAIFWDAFSELVTEQLVARDRSFDVISGVAGSAGALARRFTAFGEPVTRNAVELIAHHLIKNLTEDGNWIGQFSSRALNGLAHGSSGIGIALIEIGVALENTDFIDAGARAMSTESADFVASAGNWRDLREHNTKASEDKFMYGWCAGAPGIALTRMRALELVPDHNDGHMWRHDLALAAHTTASTGVVGLDSICCGNLGRALILSYLGDSTGQDQWNLASKELLEAIQSRAASLGGFRITAFGSPELQAPSLFKGLAGVGFALNQISGTKQDRIAARHLFI